MGNKDSDKTKQYKIKAEKQTKNKKEGKKKGKKKHSKLKKAILICFILMVLAGLTGVGIVAGIFLSDKWTLTREELIANENSVVLDSKGKQIAVLSATDGDANRKIVSFDQMGKYTADAYVVVEDKRFYEHDGVDILRTGKATISYLLHRTDGSSVGGGSTITQQLVKNLMKDDAGSGKEGIERKIREMSRAYQLEKILNKQEILEKYLNVIFIGGRQLCGVEYGAQYYFAKSAKDLDLAESCFLAGINHSPNAYNPYNEELDNKEKIKVRTKFVLDLMKEQNKISDNPEEAEKIYNEALAKIEKGFKFKQGKFDFENTNSYFVEQAVREAAQDLAKQKDIDYKEAVNIIRGGGYKLYTTQDTAIQKTVVSEMAKKSYVESRTATWNNGKKNVTKKVQTQAGMTIIDFKTGKVVAMGGAFGSDVGTNNNYAMTGRQTGSSIKPLANVSTGLEEKVIQASTVYEDTTTEFAGVNGGRSYRPKNAGGYQGLCTVRKSIEVSSNIVNIKIFSNIGAKTVIDYLHAFGLDTYTMENDAVLSLAIGGANGTSSTLQMAAAYAALANDGVYIEPTFYNKLVNSDGETVLEPEQEKHRVISAANAYIVKQIMMDVVTGSQGTANECYMANFDVAAKTGTTENDGDTWLCGITPYYAAATWNGFPESNSIPLYNVGNARKLWANVMKSVHKNKKAARFKKPDNVVTRSVCRTSGKLATKNCGSTYTEYFTEDNLPKTCDGHEAEKICKETGKLANQYCPEVEEKVFAKKPEKEQNAGWKVVGKDKYSVPTEKCTKHNEETNKVVVENVVGKTETEARTLLAGLTITVIEGHDATLANGVVLTQSLEAGTKVEKGVAITITVNKITTTDPGGTTTPGENTTSPGENTTNPGGTTTNPGGTTPTT